MPATVYIGIGSNLGNPGKNCEQAIEHLNHHPDITVVSRSSLYETEPVGIAEQDWFINAALEAQTGLTPTDLLQALLEIERKMGRERREKWGPRLIDLDLLFYDDLKLVKEGITLPHPEIANRRFVLEPLCEIAGNYRHPVLNKTLADLLALLPAGQIVRRID